MPVTLAKAAAVAAFGAVVFLPSHAPGDPAPTPPRLTNPEIPADAAQAYSEVGSLYCPEIDDKVLAGIGAVETHHGTDDDYDASGNPSGVRWGANYAGAEGPMQVLGSTAVSVQQRHPDAAGDPHNMKVAVRLAGHYLCDAIDDDGVDVDGAILEYNHSEEYLRDVNQKIAQYRDNP